VGDDSDEVLETGEAGDADEEVGAGQDQGLNIQDTIFEEDKKKQHFAPYDC